MSKIRGRRTGLEMVLHNFLKGNRVRHKMWPGIFGNPDVLIKDTGVVVFANGCFWHGCGEHFRLPKSNRKFWKSKIEDNIRRQKMVVGKLRRMGYGVLILWEHNLRGLSDKSFESEQSGSIKAGNF